MNMRIYYYRHQAAGVCHAHPFSAPPSAEQLEAMRAAMRAAHGPVHPKTGAPYWDRVVEVETDRLPEPAPAGGDSSSGSGEMSELRAEGKGHVANP